MAGGGQGGGGIGVEGSLLNVVVGLVLGSDFASKLSDGVDAAVGPASEKAGETFGKKFSEKVGDSLGKVGKELTMKVSAPLAAVGTAAVASFLTLDEGLDKVRVQTGATGDALAGLEDSVKTLATSSSVGFGDAADIVSTLYSRLNLAGEPLDALALQIANIGEVTGKALDPTSVADFFSAFDIPVDKQTEQLDKLFAIAQKTGVPFEQLLGTLEQNAAKFQQLGFSADEAAVILAQVEKSGFSADTVIAGLTKSIIKSTGSSEDLAKIEGKLADAQDKRATAADKLAVAQKKLAELQADPKAKESSIMAAQAAIDSLQRDITSIDGDIAGFQSALSGAFEKAGVSGKDAFQGVIKQIQELVAAGDEAGASALAKETFGKGFIEVLQAAKEGAFDFKGLNDELGDTNGTIEDLTAATADFPKSLDIARKSIATALEPAGAQIGLIIQQFTTQLIPIIQQAGDIFAGLSPEVQKTIVVIGGLAAALGPVISTLAKVSQIVTGLGPLFAKVGTALMANPWLLALAAVVAIGIVIYKNWDAIAAFFSRLWESLKAGASGVFEAIKGALSGVGDFIKGLASSLVGGLQAIVDAVRGVFSGIWDGIVAATGAAWDFIKNIVERYVGIIIGIVDVIKQIGEAIWDGLKRGTETAFSFVKNIIDKYIGLWRKAFEGLLNIGSTIWNGLKAGTEAAFAFVKGIIDRYVKIYTGIFDAVARVGGRIWDGLKNGAVNAINTVTNIAKGIVNAIARAWNSTVAKIAFSIPKWVPVIGGQRWGVPTIPYLAKGGPAEKDMPHIVGERGPELFVPNVSGTVVPNNKLSGALSGSTSYSITINNPVAEPASTSIPNALRQAAYLRG